MKLTDRMMRLISYILFCCAFVVTIFSNAAILLLYDHQALHILISILFWGLHFMLYFFVRHKPLAIFLLAYWIAALLITIFSIIYLTNFYPLRSIRFFLTNISYFIPGMAVVYFPGGFSYRGLSIGNSTILFLVLCLLFAIIYSFRIINLKSK